MEVVEVGGDVPGTSPSAWRSFSWATRRGRSYPRRREGAHNARPAECRRVPRNAGSWTATQQGNRSSTRHWCESMVAADSYRLGYHDVDGDRHAAVLVANMDATADW